MPRVEWFCSMTCEWCYFESSKHNPIRWEKIFSYNFCSESCKQAWLEQGVKNARMVDDLEEGMF